MENRTDYIFSINTGRSGSDYLKDIFNHVSGCRSVHEPNPIGNGRVMRNFSQGYLEPMRKCSQEKVEVIKEQKLGCQVYVETNHCFIKEFGWFVPQYIPEASIGVIILKRDKIRVAQSLLRIGCSPLVPLGRDWISTPDMRDPLVTPPRRIFSPKATYQCVRFVRFFLRGSRALIRKIFRQNLPYPKWLINYELDCLKWYVEETYEKAEVFRKRYPGIKYFEVDIEDLNSFERVQEMLSYFGCSCKESLIDIVGNPTNLKRPKYESSD